MSGPGSTTSPIASSATGNGAATDPASRTSWPRRPGHGARLLLQELLRVERELRLSAGETPTPDEYRRRFPDDPAAVDAAFGITDRPRSAPSQPPSAARSLLFGLLALQNNFINRDALLAAFNVWVADKSQSLGQILLDRGALSPARHAALDVLVQEHLQQHGQDPERSLAVLTVVPEVRDDLEGVPDLDLQASLLYLRLAGTDGEERPTASAPRAGTTKATPPTPRDDSGSSAFTTAAPWARSTSPATSSFTASWR